MNKKIVSTILWITATAPAGAVVMDHADSRLLLETVADSSRVIDLDEVIVVAQPKENARLRLQPLASNVFTDKELRTLGISSLSSLSAYVPSFAVPDYGSRYTSSVYVRGLGSRQGDPAVGMYYDNVPLVSKASLNRHLYQLDRIDVLRGPQGTLYGMNAESGLLRVYTKNPMSYQGTDILMSIGTDRTGRAEVAQYHRPSERLAFSVAAFYDGQRGFFENTNLGQKNDLSNEAGGRMRFLLKPTDRLTLDLTADYQYVNQNGFAYGEYHTDDRSFDLPSTTLMNGYKRQMASGALNVGYTTDRLMLSWVASYQYLHDLMVMDQDYLPADYLQLQQRQLMNALTQELSLRSRGTGRWQHASGLFFSREWLKTDAPVNFGDDMNLMIKRGILSAVMANDRVPAAVKTLLQGMTLSDNQVPGLFHTPVTDMGIYHESHLRIAPHLTATAGLRYDWQRVSIDYDTRSEMNIALKGNVMGQTFNLNRRVTSVMNHSAAETYHQLLPKVALTYDFNGGNVYATVSKGFRAGGYNLQMFADIFQTEQQSMGQELMTLIRGDYNKQHTDEDYEAVNNTISYKPETSWNYEIGSRLNLFGGKLHADLSAYMMQIRNQQLSVMAGNYGYGRMMVNAGRSRSLGAEMTLRGSMMADRLTWTATYSYTHSTFRDYTDQMRSADGYRPVDYRGHKVPFIPAHAFSVAADYRIPLSISGLVRSVTIGADVTGNGPVYWDAANTTRQSLYAVAGAHASFNLGRHVSVNLWGRNLTDTYYATFLVNSSVDGVSRSFAQRGRPIQAGADLSIKL